VPTAEALSEAEQLAAGNPLLLQRIVEARKRIKAADTPESTH
jgi:hypothetical protein